MRISKFRTVFTRGFPRLLVKLTNPTTYLLKDFENKQIDGAFYSQELQKVHNENIYLIEKVLRRKKHLAKFYHFKRNFILKKIHIIFFIIRLTLFLVCPINNFSH